MASDCTFTLLFFGLEPIAGRCDKFGFDSMKRFSEFAILALASDG